MKPADPASPSTAETVLAGLIDRQRLAAELNRGERTIIRYERAGLPFIKIGRHRLYEPAKVRAWLLSHERRPTAPKPGRPRNNAA